MLKFIRQPWPWYVAGPLIGLIVPALLLAGNKSFGISSSLRQICAACFPAEISFFKYDWKKQKWNLFFVAGIVIGGFIATSFLSDRFVELLPSDIFNVGALMTLRGFLFIAVGGFLVGFGTRYAGGCTSGHSIMGISNLQWPSFLATCCFMIGGLVMTWFISP
ncbi:MAG: YeeE/YedE thiosulfate transporter family protein [Bacteroidota bacterium]|nr:YeeE/YedE thiosulfate transporter family protein [Bacteroidota bacterium]